LKVYHDISNYDKAASVSTVGIFDGVHKGHEKILKRIVEIAKQRNLLSTVFTLWPHPRQVFNPDDNKLRFLTTIEEKLELLEKIGIDQVIIYPFDHDFAKLTACEFIKEFLVDQLNTKYLVAGFNHKFGSNQEGDYINLKNCAQSYDFEIEKLDAFLEEDLKVSSTLIRECILKGEIVKANQFLGYNYFINGHVVGGSKIGRTIGFPTANIQRSELYKLVPSDGVYAVKVNVNGDSYNGMLNIGLRPTIDGENTKKSIEVHILDYDGDLYNKTIRVNFIKKVRDEKKFIGVEGLKKQLERDKQEIERILQTKKPH
jgi:riboflavin kinase / FMN adenylyltransferase